MPLNVVKIESNLRKLWTALELRWQEVKLHILLMKRLQSQIN